MNKLIIKYKDFATLEHSELTSHSSNWIKFRFVVDGKTIDNNELVPLGAVYHLGEYYVERFSLNDTMKTFTVYLRSNPN